MQHAQIHTPVRYGAAPAAIEFRQQEAKIIAPDGTWWDGFGSDVSISGDFALVGAMWDDDVAWNSGSAYLFHHNGLTWSFFDKLHASDPAQSDDFGHALAIDGDVALIAAYGDDDNGPQSGSAYVFRYDGSAWHQEAKLTASDGAPDDRFGVSVALSGDVALVSAYTDDNGVKSGAAYVFRYNGSSWKQEAKLLAPDGAPYDYFGRAVGIDGDVALIAAERDDDSGEDSGSAYVFRHDGAAWQFQQKLTASDGETFDYYGCAVSLSGDVALVGAYQEGENGPTAGAAYVFRCEAGQWSEEAKLLASDGELMDRFGYSVAVDGGVAIIGAPSDGFLFDTFGSAYHFVFDGSAWKEVCKLRASDEWPDLWLADRVAISGDRVLVGAQYDDPWAPFSGSAYLFRLDTPLCSADVNGDGVVNVEDVHDVLVAWSRFYGPEDINGDDIVDVLDLMEVLLAWGPCGEER